MKNEGFSWRNRRRAIWASLFFDAIVIAWVLHSGRTDSVAEVALTMAFLHAGAVIGSYAFGAAWENRK